MIAAARTESLLAETNSTSNSQEPTPPNPFPLHLWLQRFANEIFAPESEHTIRMLFSVPLIRYSPKAIDERASLSACHWASLSSCSRSAQDLWTFSHHSTALSHSVVLRVLSCRMLSLENSLQAISMLWTASSYWSIDIFKRLKLLHDNHSADLRIVANQRKDLYV